MNNNSLKLWKVEKKLKIKNAKSTSQAQRCSTWQIGRDSLFSTRYCRNWKSTIMKEFCDRSSHTLISFSHSLSYTHFSNRVVSRALCFSLDWNRNAISTISSYISQTQRIIHTTYSLPEYFWGHYPLRGSNAFTANRPFWTGSEWFVYESLWCKSWRKKPRRERVHCNWVAPTVRLGQTSLKVQMDRQ